MSVVRHSGKLGDIVYSLPAVRALGKSRYFIRLGDPLTEVEAQQVLPLLTAQPYIESAAIWTDELIDYDLDRFRTQKPIFTNLADCHLFALGLASFPRDRQWIVVPQVIKPPKPIAIARSLSFHGCAGFWQIAYPQVKDQAYFVGTPSERQEFERLFGPIEYWPTADLLQLAQVLAGSKLFIGNQSCPYAIAEGLKMPCIQEVYPVTPNCIFERPDAAYITHPGQILPAIDRLLGIKQEKQ